MPMSDTERKETADKIMGYTVAIHDLIWQYADYAGAILPAPVKVSQQAIGHTLNNIAVNEFDENPAKYTIKTSVGAVVGTVAGFAGKRFGAPTAATFAAGGTMFGEGAVDAAYENWDWFRNWVDSLNNYNGTIAEIPSNVSEFMQNISQRASQTVQDLADTISQLPQKTADAIYNAFARSYETFMQGLVDLYEWTQLPSTQNMFDEYWKEFKEFMNDLFGLNNEGDDSGNGPNGGDYDPSTGFNNAKGEYMTPIALDLNGSGAIQTYSSSSLLNKAFFDMDNDNFREKTQWLNPVDGWLAKIINTNSTNDNSVFDKRKIVG